MRTIVLAAAALLSACAMVDRDVSGDQRSIRYSDLPAEIRNVMRLVGDPILLVDTVPWEWTWTPLGEDGQMRLVDGLPVSEDCRMVSWSVSPGDSLFPGKFVVDGHEGELHIKGVVVPVLPFGNWRTVWMGDVSMPAEYEPK